MLASGNVKESIKQAKVEKEMLESTESETMMNEAAEAEVAEDEVVDESKFPVLLLKRVKRKGADGKEYRNYFVFGRVRGRDVEVAFDPKDKGGYRVLDIVYACERRKVSFAGGFIDLFGNGNNGNKSERTERK